MKRTWPVLLAWLLLVQPAAVQAQYGYSTNGDGSIYAYSTNADGSVTIVAYTGPPWVVAIPSHINSLTVTAIGDGQDVVFPANLTGVTIPGTVTSIADYAFSGTALAAVTIPGSVASIGDYAFDSCSSLAAATISNGVAGIGDYAFCQSGLAGVTIPGSVVSIGNYALYDTSLTNATIQSGVASIGQSAFSLCETLPSITIPGSVTNIGQHAFDSCVKLTNAILGNGVAVIGGDAFYKCFSLAAVTIPRSVVSIGSDAFYDTSLAAVTIPAGVTNLGSYAFAQCSALAAVFFAGNAPAADLTVFSTNSLAGNGYENATAYYLPGKTGWSNTFAGLTTVLWNPLIQTGDGNFGARAGQFGFDITGTANIPIVVEACANLATPVWTPLQSLTLTNGLFYFSEPMQTSIPARFYRIGSQ